MQLPGSNLVAGGGGIHPLILDSAAVISFICKSGEGSPVSRIKTSLDH